MASSAFARFTAGMPRAALTSGVLMGAGDCMCQAIQRRQARQQQQQQQQHAPGKGGKPAAAAAAARHDWARTARFAVIGLTLHGPFFLVGFRALDRVFGTGPGFRLVRDYRGCCVLRGFVLRCVLCCVLSSRCALRGPERA
jgi:hypothetical protein